MRRVPRFLRPRFKLVDEYSELRRHRSREGVVLVPERFPDCCERSPPIAGRIDFALRGTGNDVPTYPVIDPVSCGEKVGHGRSPRSFHLLFRADYQNSQSIYWVPHIRQTYYVKAHTKTALTLAPSNDNASDVPHGTPGTNTA
jgi:hypothetical protein